MLSLIPATYRIPAMVLAAIALVLFGWVRGASFEQGQQAKRELAAERATSARVVQRRAVSNRIDLKYAPALTQIRTVTKTLIKEVPTYVSANDCPMSPGFRLLHDAAAKGVIPDTAGIADAAAVPAPDVAATVADNYGACIENAKRFEGLQEWITEQLKLNPPNR